MPDDQDAFLSVSALFAAREAREQHDRDAENQMKRKKEEELADYRKRLEEFKLTDAQRQKWVEAIKRSFEKGESELLLVSFPSGFCTDSGRAISNAGEPPITKPDKTQARSDEPEWLATLPAGAHQVYDFWKTSLAPGGFGFSARIMNYPDGKPGDVGLFFTWPKSPPEKMG